MNRSYILLAVFFVVFSFMASSMILAAQKDSDMSEENLLISNNLKDEQVPSVWRYSWEKFKLNFIRNQTIKAERELQMASWKVAEARMAAQNGDLKRSERAIAENEKIIARVQERISKMDNASLTQGLGNAIQVHEQRMVNLNVALQNANLSEEQRTRIEAQIGKIDNVTNILEQNRERIQNRVQSIEGFNANGSEVQEVSQNSNSQQSGRN